MKKAIMTMGLPGAGKSTVLNKNYDMSKYVVIDPDEIKKEKADYSDSNPSVYHEWSKREAKARLARAVADEQNVIVDGTGTNVEKMYKTIADLQSAGYSVTLLYVKVSLQTAIERNQSRARTVPENIVLEKFETISYAFEILSGAVNKVKVVNND